MMRNLLIIAAACAMLAGAGCLEELVKPGGKGHKKEGGLSEATIAAGLREALDEGARRAVDRLSQAGGYARDAQLRIPLPPDLEDLAAKLKQIGLEDEVQAFVETMNAAAEQAAREAVPVFADAVRGMTIDDAKAILHGGANAATQYFRDRTLDELRQRYLPVVTRAMEQVGAVRKYNGLVKKYNAIPFVEPVTFAVEDYVTDKALRGLFAVIAAVEKDIRANAAARTTDLLRRVFG